MISVITPVFNEEKTLDELFKRLQTSFHKVNENFELIFVDNGSTDGSLQNIKKIAEKYDNVKFLSLTKNFGHQGGIWAGLSSTENTAVIIDSDLQQPPEIIEEFIKKWKEGFKIIKTKKILDQDTRSWKKFMSRMFYKSINRLTKLNLFAGQSDFCLLDKEVVKEIKKFSEKKSFLRGIINFTGFKSCYVEYEVLKRPEGISKFSKIDYFNFAVDGIFNYSKAPITILFWTGLVTSIFCLFYIFYLLFLYFFYGADSLPAGWVTVSILLMFFGSLNLLSFSMIGKYILLILEDGKNRPEFFIKEKNF